MKQIVAIIALTLSILTAYGQGLTADEQKVVTDFIDCFKNKNKEKLISKISFPIKREYPIPPIENRQEFLERYNEIFDDKLTKVIVNSNPLKDWSAVGWRGIMLLDGQLWLEYDGKLITVNYQSQFESKKKIELINQEKRQLHESLKEFEKPVLIFETTTYRIRIDNMGKDNYRYAAWKLNSKMSDKPDIIIQNGKYVWEGTGGNHRYKFINGDYTYDCAINVMRDADEAPANLTVYKGDEELFSQKAIRLMN